MLSVWCEKSDWAAAAREAHEVLQRVTIARNRWDIDRDLAARGSLNLVLEHLEIVRLQTAKFTKKEPSTDEIDAIQRSLGGINKRLSAEVGKHERLADATLSE